MKKRCRICLKLVPVYELLSDMKEILAIIMLDMTSNLTNCVICLSCKEYIIGIFNFKTRCIYTEDLLYPCFNDNKIDIKMFHPKFDKTNTEEVVHICRLCFEIVHKNFIEVIEESTQEDRLSVMLKKYLPEIDLFKVDKPIICEQCQVILYQIDDFFIGCKINEKNILNLCNKKSNLRPTNVDALLLELGMFRSNGGVDRETMELDNTELENPQVFKKSTKIADLESAQEISPCGSATEEEKTKYVDPRQCRYCGYKVKFKSALKNHYIQHTNPADVIRYSCNKCTFTTLYKYNLQTHKKCHLDPAGTETFQCANCTYQTIHKTLLVKHMRFHKTEKRFSCKICGASYKYPSGLYMHSLKHKENKDIKFFKCSTCNAEFQSKQNLNRHKLIHSSQRPYKCNLCPHAAKRQDQLKSHILWHCLDSGIRIYRCSQCSYAGKHPYHLKIHMLVHSNVRTFQCSQCSYRAKSLCGLNRHNTTHSGVKKFKCDTCQFKTSRYRILKRHKLIHTGQKPLSCDKCVYKTMRIDGLKRHMKLVHPPEVKLLKCDKCIFTCKYQKTLEKHSLLHSSLETYSCTVCSYQTKEFGHYQKHVAFHSSNSSWFKCSTCSFETSNKVHLSRHELSHSDERLYKCHLCDFAGKRRDTVKRHQLIRHEKSVNETFECYDCGYVYRRKDSLVEHIKRKHGCLTKN